MYCKNIVGSGEAKKLVCTTHGRKLRGGGMLEGMVVPGRGRLRGEKKWDNCNSIINKLYLKKELMSLKLLVHNLTFNK